MSAKIEGKKPYFRRQPVAKFGAVDRVVVNRITRTVFYFMSFYNGPGLAPTFAELVGRAPVDAEGFLKIDAVPEGCIIVDPGLVYRPIPLLRVSGKMMAEHEKAMKKWKPKTQLVYEKDDAPAVDLGPINLSGLEKK